MLWTERRGRRAASVTVNVFCQVHIKTICFHMMQEYVFIFIRHQIIMLIPIQHDNAFHKVFGRV